MADGNVRDTIPAPPLRDRIRGQQSSRDGALIPDINGELPWPLLRAHGTADTAELLGAASLRHSRKPCFGFYGHDASCDGEGACIRHAHTEVVAQAAEQIRAVLEVMLHEAEVDGELARVLVRDALDEATKGAEW